MPGQRWNNTNKSRSGGRERVIDKWFKDGIGNKQKGRRRKVKGNGVEDQAIDNLVKQRKRIKVESGGKMDVNIQYTREVPVKNC